MPPVSLFGLQRDRSLLVSINGSVSLPFRRLRLETLDGRVSSRSDPDPFDLDAEEIFDKGNVLLTVLGQRFECSAFRDIGFPTGESNVFDFGLGEEIEIGWKNRRRKNRRTAKSTQSTSGFITTVLRVNVRLTRESFHFFPIKLVLGPHLDFLKPIENIELGQVQRSVTVDHSGVLHDDEIEPSGSTSTTCSHSPFSTNFLKLNSDVLWQKDETSISSIALEAQRSTPTLSCSVGKGPPPTLVV
jgi:hypothetical protein